MTNKERTRQHFIDIGEWQKFEKPVMHHKDPSWRHNDPERYNEWRVEDIVVMEDSAHKSLHGSGENSNFYGVHRYGEDNPNYGHRWSDEKRLAASGENNPWYGKHHTEEQKASWSAQRKGKSHHSEYQLNKARELCLSDANPAKTPEARRKNSEWHKGREGTCLGKKMYNNGDENRFFIPGEEPDGWVLGRKK